MAQLSMPSQVRVPLYRIPHSETAKLIFEGLGFDVRKNPDFHSQVGFALSREHKLVGAGAHDHNICTTLIYCYGDKSDHAGDYILAQWFIHQNYERTIVKRRNTVSAGATWFYIALAHQFFTASGEVAGGFEEPLTDNAGQSLYDHICHTAAAVMPHALRLAFPRPAG